MTRVNDVTAARLMLLEGFQSARAKGVRLVAPRDGGVVNNLLAMINLQGKIEADTAVTALYSMVDDKTVYCEEQYDVLAVTQLSDARPVRAYEYSLA